MSAQAPQFSLPPLPFEKLSFLFGAPTLMIIFVLFLVAYLVVSIILFYHWIAYGMRHAGILVAEVLFTGVSIALFCVASLAIHYF